jgi:hypothetical protein
MLGIKMQVSDQIKAKLDSIEESYYYSMRDASDREDYAEAMFYWDNVLKKTKRLEESKARAIEARRKERKH